MTDDERSSHFGWVRVELEDTTDEEARWFFERLDTATIERDGLEATVVRVQLDPTPEEERERERWRREGQRYHGD